MAILPHATEFPGPCLLRKGPLREAVFLVDEGCGEMMLSVLEALSQSPNRWISGKQMCLLAFTVKNMSLWLFRDLP